jgi:hypothetical protein
VSIGVAAVAAAFALLDVREALHQHHEARPSLVAAACALAIAHGVAAGLGLVVAASTSRAPEATSTS